MSLFFFQTRVVNKGKDILGYVSANIFYKFSFYLLIIWIAKFLGKSELGKYFFLFSLPGIFLPFSELGINTLLTREIARSGKKTELEKIISSILGLRLSLIFFLYLSIGIVSLISRPNILPLLLLSSLFLSVESLYSTFASIFIGFQKIKYNILCGVISRICLVFLVYFILKLGGELIHVLLAHLLASIILLGMGWHLGKKITLINFRKPDKKFFLNLIVNSLPFSIIAYLPPIYYRIDSVMLTLFHGFKETGIYGAGFKIREASLLLPQCIMIVLFPVIAGSYREKPFLNQIFKETVRIFFPSSLFLSLCTIFFTRKIVYLIYGQEFLDVIKILRLLFSTLPFVFLNLALISFLKGTGNERKCAVLLLLLLIGKLILNYLLIPPFASSGAVISTITIDLALFLFLFYYWRKWKTNFCPS